MNIRDLNADLIRENVILPAISRANDTMPNFFLAQIDDSVVFYGRPKAVLDSLNLVSFVFILEEQVEDFLNIKIKITTQDVLNTDTPPFAGLKNLSEFLLSKIQTQASST
jgi:hypothetical protein